MRKLNNCLESRKMRFNKKQINQLKELVKEVKGEWGILVDKPRLAELNIYILFGDSLIYGDKGIIITGQPGHGKTSLIYEFQKNNSNVTNVNSEDMCPLYCSGKEKPLLFPAKDLSALIEGQGIPLDLVIYLNEGEEVDGAVREMDYSEVLTEERLCHGTSLPFRNYYDSLRYTRWVMFGKPMPSSDYRSLDENYVKIEKIIKENI